MISGVTSKLQKAQGRIRAERERWEERKAALQKDLESSHDKVYIAKRRNRDLVAGMVKKTRERESQLQNYIHSLEERQRTSEQERSQALRSLEEVKGKSARERRLVNSASLTGIGNVTSRRLAEDDAVAERKRTSELQRCLSKLQLAQPRSETTDEEGVTDAEDQRKSGGRQKWPIWVVQLICELLVNGTSPTAIPANISTMYATLFGETVSPPGKHFCRRCRTVVQVAGETIAAINWLVCGAGNNSGPTQRRDGRFRSPP